MIEVHSKLTSFKQDNWYAEQSGSKLQLILHKVISLIYDKLCIYSDFDRHLFFFQTNSLRLVLKRQKYRIQIALFLGNPRVDIRSESQDSSKD